MRFFSVYWSASTSLTLLRNELVIPHLKAFLAKVHG